MKRGNVYICNVCSIESSKDKEAVFIKAHKGGETVHICTDCFPKIIHESAKLVKTNHRLESEFYEEFRKETE